jgi:hypothetical protein
MRRLLLQWMHHWPHRDGAGPEIVGGSHQGAPAVVVGAAGAIVLAFLIRLALTLAFAAIVGVGLGGRGAAGGHDGSCYGGCRGSCSGGGRPPPDGAE